MTSSGKMRFPVWVAVWVPLMVSCVSTQIGPVSVPPPPSQSVKIPIVVSAEDDRTIPKGAGIVIEDISGDCSEEVEDALISRLIDNTGYNVLTRDNLAQIFGEANMNWEGRFNTETVNKLGELVGASMFVVGRVGYCGTEVAESPDTDFGLQFTIIAVLQIIDMETGKVILATSDRGIYIPRSSPSLPLGSPAERPKPLEAGSAETGSPTENVAPPRKAGLWQGVKNVIVGGGATQPSQDERSGSSKGSKARALGSEPLGYLKIKAAEDLAGSFADKFFSRATWEEVNMFETFAWKFGESVPLVRLGHCSEAVNRLENGAAEELPYMNDAEVAKYLHNYGVALLCANRPKEAMRKLRSAYRVESNQSTLKMLDLAERITEWSLHVDVDEEPEVGMLLRRQAYEDD